MTSIDPYDDVPYKCLPIEWTAPERLALTSLLHGGPRAPSDGYRVLELGSGNGANLLPLAYYRRLAEFVGIDRASSQIEVAVAGKTRLHLSNVEFIHADFLNADDRLAGQFDYIIGHGIFSWVPPDVRDALLALCAKRLRRGGLLYLNYNANPGWRIRGMVRDFLLAQTAGGASLRTRAEAAQDVSARIALLLPAGGHPYAQLLANEFKFVCENDISYVAHEYLARDNRAYWRSEFLTLVEAHGLEFVADADFNYSSGSVPEDIVSRLMTEQIHGRTVGDTVDLLCYRQLHSPILTKAPLTRRPPSPEEFAALSVASCLAPCASEDGYPTFEHPSGYRVEAKERAIQSALETLRPLWPRGLPIGAVFHDVSHVMDDVQLLYRNGLIDLRCVEPRDFGVREEPAKALDFGNTGFVTTVYHTREPAVV
jgi:SAM-dependent methyltransferase